jgi:glucose-6-phosphate 1-dehydrogenase
VARHPTLVIFGASGSLTSRKLIPALFNLYRKKRLPDGLRIVGVARHGHDDDSFRNELAAALRADPQAPRDPDAWAEFARAIRFVKGDVSEPDGLAAVRRVLDTDKAGAGSDAAADGGRLLYLALAPWLYDKALVSLQRSGLAAPGADEAAWRRVVIEKPFGRDLESARALNRRILEVFRESQVFRIDHYLGKETVQNILVFRFGNVMFEPLWHRNMIDHIQITVAESGTVGDRGAYYDGAGVLRDMFQNHLIQLLSLVAMGAPNRFEANALRGEKVKLLDSVRRIPAGDAGRHMILGQYDGYRGSAGVRRDTRTPTFAAVRLFVDNWRWHGVPFYLRSGKGLAKRMTEIVIQLHRPPHNLFELTDGRSPEPNRISLGIQPDEGVRIRFQTKVPERGMEVRSSTLQYHFNEPGVPGPDAYERLLLDALNGDASLFMRHDEIEEAWSIIDPLTRAAEDPGAPIPLSYPVGSWGPPQADALVAADGRAWVLDTASEE